MFSTPFPRAFGLDFNDLSIKLVQLAPTLPWFGQPKYRLLAKREIRLRHGLVLNGDFQQPEEVRRYLRRLLATDQRRPHWRQSPWVVASVPDTQSFIKFIHVDKSMADIIEEDVLSAAKKHIPFDEDSYYIDWQVMPSHTQESDKTGVLISAIPKIISDTYLYLLESVGLGVLALEPQALATARSMITANKIYAHEAQAILDIGASRSSFIIYDHNHIQFSSSLPYSGDLMTTAIVQTLHLSYDEAEQHKIAFGLDGKKNHAWPALVKVTDQLIDGIAQAIQFYYSHFPEGNKITHITMCGSGANLKRLDRIISLKLKIETRPGNVWKNLSAVPAYTAADQQALGLATAIGLALRAAQNPFFVKYLI